MNRDKPIELELLSRRDVVADAVRQGWIVASADEGFITFEADERWQLTAWFGSGRLGLLTLYDALTDATLRCESQRPVPSPAEAAQLLADRDPSDEQSALGR
jgi:hypothetical protein